MSKTNLYTLIATALLGVLLYVVVQIAGQLASVPVAEPVDLPGITPEDQRLMGSEDLLELLHARGLDGELLMLESADWRRQRGFLGGVWWLGNPEPDTHHLLDTQTLEKMGDDGDMAALQTLAERVRMADPFAAIKLHTAAAERGSIYSMLQIGSLRETLGSLDLDRLRSSPDFLRQLAELRHEDSKRTLQMEAFAYVAAAARDGGPAVIDSDMLGWMQRMERDLNPGQRSAACELSASIFLEISAARRSRGVAPLRMTPPPVFLAIRDLEQQLPCRTTSYPIPSLLDMSQCSMTPVGLAGVGTANLYICDS